MLPTHVFDPSPCHFPQPRVPLLPQGTAGINFLVHRPDPDAVRAVQHFTRGRYALHEAYRLAGVSAQGALLAPAYHCRTMVDPALALDAPVLLYRVLPNLMPDMPDVERLLDGSVPVKAVLATHFFGVPKCFEPLKALCSERDIRLVEDCSHSFFVADRAAPGIGDFGDYVVSSPYKFLPCPDGGLLWSASPPERGAGEGSGRQSLMAEARGFVSMLLAGLGRKPAHPGDIALAFALAARRAQTPGLEACRPEACSRDYRRDDELLPPLCVSRLLQRCADLDFVGEQRRRRYRQWAQRVAGLPNCKALYPTIPDDSVPYMFPLLLDRNATDFYMLKHLAMPIWRWDSIVASSCPTANRYRASLIHLPCHQSLSDANMDWLLSTLDMVMRDTASLEIAGGRW